MTGTANPPAKQSTMSVHADPPPAIVSEPHGTSYATAHQLGKGGFAICFEAERLEQNKPTGHIVALKIVRTKMEPAKLAQKFVTELQIHSKLSHSNIVGFHRAFSFGESTYVVLELCSNGSLADMLKRRKSLTMPEIRRFIVQVSGAVKYLHARNIVHRDLKTGNLFLDEHMNIKVGDFGLAALLVSGKDMDAKRRTTMCGTPNYLAPEILEKGKGHNEKVDLWAIGIIAYTLAVGRAPFHAASKDEIYKKLKAGDYSWPELSSINNDISADLRDLVGSLLVPEEMRPSPDHIVSHSFFKIAFIPKHMSRSQLTKVPAWPHASLPTPEVLQRGYSDTWFHACKESGVGEYLPGKFFQLNNSGKRIRSVVRDIEREIVAGCQPVLPIPADTVYPCLSDSNSWPSSSSLDEVKEESEPVVETRHLKAISSNEVQLPEGTRTRNFAEAAEIRKRKDAELMPPPVAAARRTATFRTVRSARVKPTEDDADRLPVPQAVPRLTQEKPDSAEEAVPSKRSVDASLARRPRTLRRNLTTREAIPQESATSSSDKDNAKVMLPGRPARSRTRTAPEIVEIYDEAPIQQQRLALPSPPDMKVDLPRPKTQGVQSTAFPGTHPSDVLDRLCSFRDSLAAALEKKRLAPRRPQPELKTPLPFVNRWVDYSRKYGVGYVLEDGTVGYIANADAVRGTPVTHVAVRNGESWLRRAGKRFEHLDQVPFQIVEDCGPEGLKAINMSNEQQDKQRERLRMLKVLWVKFGRYMAPNIHDSEESTPEHSEGEEEAGYQGDLLFVRFYQRLGNVGIWGFSDGCIQIHFPDHTKLVFSPQGTHVSATLVSVEGVAAIEQTNNLPLRLLREREVLMESTHSILYGSQSGRGQKGFAGVVKANMVEQKMRMVKEIVEQWIAGGGLGCGQCDDRFQWQGPSVSDHSKKSDWVTVGRYGGDRGDVVSR